jgi:F0F1-type ATP synthase assembly protein I
MTALINALTAAMKRPDWPRGMAEKLWDAQHGRCYHCKQELPSKNIHPREYDIDHFPIPFRDIEDNVLPSFMLKVNSSTDENNIVASCRACNRSHLYETKGRTQLFFSARVFWFLVTLIASMMAGFLIGIVTAYINRSIATIRLFYELSSAFGIIVGIVVKILIDSILAKKKCTYGL